MGSKMKKEIRIPIPIPVGHSLWFGDLEWNKLQSKYDGSNPHLRGISNLVECSFERERYCYFRLGMSLRDSNLKPFTPTKIITIESEVNDG